VRNPACQRSCVLCVLGFAGAVEVVVGCCCCCWVAAAAVGLLLLLLQLMLLLEALERVLGLGR